MEKRSYYVVELELFKGNFRHRAILQYDGQYGKNNQNHGTLFSGNYEAPRDVVIENLHHFEVISKIEEMDKRWG